MWIQLIDKECTAAICQAFKLHERLGLSGKSFKTLKCPFKSANSLVTQSNSVQVLLSWQSKDNTIILEVKRDPLQKNTQQILLNIAIRFLSHCK